MPKKLTNKEITEYLQMLHNNLTLTQKWIKNVEAIMSLALDFILGKRKRAKFDKHLEEVNKKQMEEAKKDGK